MVHVKRSLLLLAAILAIQFLQPDGLLAANRKAKAKPKAKAAISAKSALVMEMNTGEILFSKNPNEPIAPASLTKILTLYLIYEALDEGNIHTSDRVRVSSSVNQVEGSRMRIRP
jgi:D-alanyl-D-alanine carboxypeptidase (penicillin-binding protein 5/6)